MKTKKQLTFGALALVLLSGLAATSTTFAWFTTTRTASITFSNATIENRSSNLEVSYSESLNSFATVDNTVNDIKLTGANRVTDVSGNGIDLYKPVWAATNNVASQIDEVTSTVANSADGKYVDFLVKVARQSDNPNPVGFKVYLGAGTAILPVDTENARDVDAVKAARMAVIAYDDASRTNPTLLHLHAPEAETSPKYLVENASTTAYSVSGYELVSAGELNTAAFVSASTQATATYQIADLTSDSEAYVGFRFWIEGTDTETTNEKALGGMFKIALDIYALEV